MTGDADDLARFVAAQDGVFERALAELRGGEKRSHWMWFVFPQIDGLGHSAMARRYAIRDRAEACAFLAHPVLGPRLRACVAAVMTHAGKRSAEAIFGGIDAIKLRSSMTLFEATGCGDCAAILDGFFGGRRDGETLRRL